MVLKRLGARTEFIVYPPMGHAWTEPRYPLFKMASEYWLNWKELLDSVPPQPAKENQ